MSKPLTNKELAELEVRTHGSIEKAIAHYQKMHKTLMDQINEGGADADDEIFIDLYEEIIKELETIRDAN